MQLMFNNDKNRDVIVAFPDVDPSFISMPHERNQNYRGPMSRRAVLEEETSSYDLPHLWYLTSEVRHALELFIPSWDKLSSSSTYRYDLVDLTRQALAKYANQLFLEIIEAYQSSNIHGVVSLSQKFLNLVEDMDTLLACHDGFLLGPWLESATQLARNKEQEKQSSLLKIPFEWNARTQITMWFDNTEEVASLLCDYDSLESGSGFQLKDWRREWIKLTTDWQNSRKTLPVESIGDTLNTSRWLYAKYLQSPSTYDH
ncbi:hypothetical protein SLEP1_g3014 [Rubroshorea leprosula]|uniref:Alpha-N-acetylglucosaminidase C-terminal domain-containing protein n=1 Tax=Rubroshorea leprosula TaxID=152421 RepID=A0AAV5HJ24_9ROSI|nr:hypothetical protein SLEP1_g3014 [Rubroshorea leprosula]